MVETAAVFRQPASSPPRCALHSLLVLRILIVVLARIRDQSDRLDRMHVSSDHEAIPTPACSPNVTVLTAFTICSLHSVR